MTISNFLMDVLPPPGHGGTRPRIRYDQEIIKSSYDQAKDSFLIVRDSLLNLDKAAKDSVANIQSSGVIDSGGDDTSMLVWSAIVVMAALALCVSLAFMYRRRLSVS